MKFPFLHPAILTAIGIYSLACIPANVAASQSFLRRAKRVVRFEGQGEHPVLEPEDPPEYSRPWDHSLHPDYLEYLKDIENQEPRSWIVRGSFQLEKDPQSGAVGIYKTNGKDGADVIKIFPGESFSKAWDRYTESFPHMDNAQYRMTSHNNNGLRSQAMERLSTLSDDERFRIFSPSPGRPNLPQLQFGFYTTTPAKGALRYAMMQEASFMARSNPQARLEIMPSDALRSVGDPDMQMQIINSLDPDEIPADVTDDLRFLAAMPIVVRNQWPWHPMPFSNYEGNQEGNFEMNRMNEFASEIEKDRTDLARILSAQISTPGLSLEKQLTEWNQARLQKYADTLAKDLQNNNDLKKMWAGQSNGKRKRSVIDTVEQQDNGGPSSQNATSAAEFEMYLNLFQASQSNITTLITPYIFDIMNLTINSSIITSLAASVFTDMTASVDQAIGPFMYGFDCLEWLESQYTNATSANDLSDDMLVVMAVHELLAKIYGTVWANATAQLTASGLWNESTTLARYITPDDLSMAPSLFTTVGWIQTPANDTRLESISSNNTVVSWKRSGNR